MQLFKLLLELQAESSQFANSPEDQQMWYNRGYANGMIKALDELGYQGQMPPDIVRDQLGSGERVSLWGKAYVHGEETGYREVFEISQTL
ncbi:MAG: hypothetical protein ACWA5Q_03240 [bacterium]